MLTADPKELPTVGEDIVQRITETAPLVTAEPYVAARACRFLGEMRGLSDPILEVLNALYCLE